MLLTITGFLVVNDDINKYEKFLPNNWLLMTVIVISEIKYMYTKSKSKKLKYEFMLKIILLLCN